MSPYSDPEKKIARMREWRKERIGQGYGKWLYQRRKLRYDDAVRFRTALEEIVEVGIIPNRDAAVARTDMLITAQEALRASATAEAAVGDFTPDMEESANL